MVPSGDLNELELSEDEESRIFRIGFFQVELDVARVEDFKRMRKFLPKAEYKLLKNRKCARLSRNKRREFSESLTHSNRLLYAENDRLRSLLGIPERPAEDRLLAP